jgi:hypothetical protein
MVASPKMRSFILILVAVVLTIGGVMMALLPMKAPVARSLWFPFAVIVKAITGSDVAMVLTALVQFPALALLIICGSSRSRVGNLIVAVVVGYLGALGICFTLLKYR